MTYTTNIDKYGTNIEMLINKKHCYTCNKYKKEYEKYKRKYEAAKSGLTKEERNAIIELICNEQIKNMLVKNEYTSEKYNMLEKLKVKIKII